MQSVETKKEGLLREYKVTVPADALNALMKARLQEIAKTAKIPGFRPGKAPLDMMEKRYGDSVMGEIVEKAVNDGTQAAIKDNKLRPATQPNVNVDSFDKGKDLEFTMSIEILPEFDVMDISKIKLERPVAKVADSEIEDAMKRIASQNRSSEKVEEARAAKSGDIIVIDYAGKLEDGTSKPGMSSLGYHLELGSNTFIPGFEDQLIGTKVGDEPKVEVQFPKDYQAEDLAGKKAIFSVKVHELRAPADAKIDDAFAKTLGMEDISALQKAIRDQMESEYGQFSRQKVKRALFDLLDEKHKFDLPKGMTEMEFKIVCDQVAQERQQQGQDPEISEEEQVELKEIAVRRVRLGLILSEIGQANNVTVSDQDLQKAIMDQARRFPGQEAQIFELFQKNKQMVDNLRAPIFEDKVVDFIIELADVTDKEVALAELTRDEDAEEEEAKEKAKKKAPAKKKAAKKD